MERFEYIDDFFKEQKPSGKQKDFEERIINESEFADDLVFYLNTIQVARNQSNEDKKKHFSEIYYQNNPPLSDSPVRRIWPYAALMAAALSALFFGLYLYTSSQASPAKLADDYLSNKLEKLNLQMGSSLTPMQLGKNLYNEKDYLASLKQFEAVVQTDTSNYYAKEYAGLAALQLNDFPKALRYFKQVSENEDLTENRGKFYQALTLMKHDQAGDKEQYVKLLHEVVNENLFGKEDAKKFLNEL